MTTSTAFRRRMIHRSGKRGFTLVELLVVIGMLALIMGAVSTSMASAMQRARIQKAMAEVKMLTQAIHSYAHYNDGKLDEISSWKVVDFNNELKYLNGEGDKDDVPVLIQAALDSGGVMRDPWGEPYRVKIQKGTVAVSSLIDNLWTGYSMPNFNHLTKDERE